MKGIVFLSGLVSGLLTSGFILPALSQVTSDGTTNTNVRPSVNNFDILNGIQKGNNLFHSFKEFSIPTGSSVTFNNSTDVVNIINRVTGGNISNIDGLIKANGNANLFLINPAGIVFGENASLNIGGSFFATSADSLLFENGFEFAAKQENTQPLLTISTPVGLQMGKGNQGLVSNQGILTVDAGNTITFLASEVNNSGTINAPSGDINLVVPAEEKLVNFDATGKIGNLNLSETMTKGIVTNNGVLNVFGETEGSIKIIGNSVELNQNTLINTGSNQDNENPAYLKVHAANNIQMSDFSIDANNSLLNVKLTAAKDIFLNSGKIETNGGEFSADGGEFFAMQSVEINSINNRNLNGAPISITADSVEMQQGQIIKKTTASGRTGNVNINAVKSIEILDGSFIGNSSEGSGNTGDINIKTDRLLFQNDSDILKEATSAKLGAINITANSIKVLNGSGFGSDAFGTANAATINVKTDTFDMENQSGIGSNTFGAGDAGRINIETGTLNIENQSGIGSDTFGAGKAGTIDIKTGTLNIKNQSGIGSNTSAAGDAGEINIKTGTLNIENQSGMGSDTFGAGKAGTIDIKTGTLNIKNQSGIGSNTSAAGDAGEINIKTGTLDIENFSGLSTDSGASSDENKLEGIETTGNAGKINIVADKIAIRETSGIASKTFGSGSAGQIIIDTGSLVMQNSGLGVETGIDRSNNIDTAIGNTADGGIIKINADVIDFMNGSGINSETGGEGEAGRIEINASKVFFNDSNINSNTLGSGKAGIIQLNADSLTLENQGNISTITFSSGEGGNIELQIKKDLALSNESYITVSSNFSDGTVDTGNQNNNQLGAAGNMNIQAGKVELNNQSRLVGETDSGKGGEINLGIQDFILLKNNSSISTTAGITGTGGNGGNIRIQSPFVVAAPSQNNDITANAFNGSGGKIEVNAVGIFGLTPRTREDLVTVLDTDDPSQLNPEQLTSNDITAISQTNPNLEGVLTINTLDNSSIQNSLTELPQNLIDTNILIANSCVARRNQQDSTFYITGKAGFPYVPGEAVPSDYSMFEVRALSDNTSLKTSAFPRKKADSIVEATGIYRLENGELVFGRECEK